MRAICCTAFLIFGLMSCRTTPVNEHAVDVKQLLASDRSQQAKVGDRLFEEFGYFFMPMMPNSILAWLSDGPCALGEYYGDYFQGRVSGNDLGGMAIFLVASACGGQVLVLQVTGTDLSGFPEEWRRELTRRQIWVIPDPENPRSVCQRHRPFFFDEYEAETRRKLQETFSVFRNPSPEVAAEIERLSQTAERLFPGEYSWSPVAQVVIHGPGYTTLPGSYLVRGWNPARDSGFSLAVDPVSGSLLELVHWANCNSPVEPFP